MNESSAFTYYSIAKIITYPLQILQKSFLRVPCRETFKKLLKRVCGYNVFNCFSYCFNRLLYSQTIVRPKRQIIGRQTWFRNLPEIHPLESIEMVTSRLDVV